MSTLSTWLKQKTERPSFPNLEEDIAVDVAIIGGGITGIMAGYHLVKAGKRVAILEQSHIGHGDTGYTTAFLTQVVDASLQHLVQTFGEEVAKNVWESNRQCIDTFERIIRTERIECEFMRCPARMYAHDEASKKHLETEVQLAQKLGFEVEWHPCGLPFPQAGYMEILDQAKFDPLKYLEAIALDIEEEGVLIYEQTHVHDVEGDGPIILRTSKGTVTATDVIVATHGPIAPSKQFAARLWPMRTYVLEAEVDSGLSEGLYWNTEDPYHYFRIDRREGKTRVLVGGEDHVTGQSDLPEAECFQRLEEYLKFVFNGFVRGVTNRWSGQIYESADGLPYIGQATGMPHVYVATGFAGNGMTYGALAGEILSSLIVHGSHPWAETYKTLRLHGAKEVVSMGANFVSEFIRGRVLPDVSTVEEIEPGFGAIIVEQGKPIAVYKNENGEVIRLSGVCTHLRCTVRWNSLEKSWDCPCHGSRFDTQGNVVNGPARLPLDRVA